jgi:hypothetical protein
MMNKSKNVARKAGSIAGNTVVMSAGVLVLAAGTSWTLQGLHGIMKTFKKNG